MNSQPTAKSETPRTDNEILFTRERYPNAAPYKVEAGFARQLERELNQWREVARELGKAIQLIHKDHGPETDWKFTCPICIQLARLSTLDNQTKGT